MPDASRQAAVISTVVLRLHKPSRRKEALLHSCLERYAEGIQQMLDRVGPAIIEMAEQGLCPPPTALARLMSPADLRQLKPLGLEPLADGLRMDLAMLLQNFLAHVRNGQPAALPVIRRSPDIWTAEARALIASCTAGDLSRRHLRLRLERTLPTIGRCKSIYFGRHAAARDFCLLHQPDSGRFYVKLHLMNRQAARDWSAASQTLQAAPAPAAASAPAPSAPAPTLAPVSAPQPGGGGAAPSGSRRPMLYHLSEGHPPLAPARPGDRFIVLPLDMGRRQHQLLLQAWQDPAMIRTARLCLKDNRFDLHVQLRQRLPDVREPRFLLGLARDDAATAAYALCRFDGQAIHQGTFDGPAAAVAAAVCQLARQSAAQVILSDLSRRDGLYRSDPDDPAAEPLMAACSRLEWQSLARQLGRLLPQAGLPPPIAVSPYHLYQTCPSCGSRRRANRLRSDLLVCTACGHSGAVSRAGSLNVVHKFLRYRHQRQQPADSDRTVP